MVIFNTLDSSVISVEELLKKLEVNTVDVNSALVIF